ncbi:hypothetical protein VPH35_056985 [Triticum aestivum]|uniref:Uncharacterized protein n=1 Tax=Triticum turgidum subsp. durum TaxID=4567 RepID=A0A9R1SAJ7_TRITD|nr:unnamed protein product [Triticum turgidum subsp. durum]
MVREEISRVLQLQMAEMVCSVVIGEAVNRTTSLLLGKEEREATPISEGVERVVKVINGQAAQHSDEHTCISWQKMDQMLLPKAIEYLCGNDQATTYQLFWESNHGTLQLSIEKIGTQVPSKAHGRTVNQAGAPRLVGRWKERKHIAVDLLKS